jgi:hypothetical protein
MSDKQRKKYPRLHVHYISLSQAFYLPFFSLAVTHLTVSIARTETFPLNTSHWSRQEGKMAIANVLCRRTNIMCKTGERKSHVF